MDGGERIGTGRKGKVYDVACIDTDSLCSFLFTSMVQTTTSKEAPEPVYIYTTTDARRRTVKQQDAMDLLTELLKRTDLVAKQFSHTNRVYFQRELQGLRILQDIFGTQTQKYTTFTSIPFKGRNILALEFNNLTYALNQKCGETALSMAKRMTQSQCNQFIQNMLQTLGIMQLPTRDYAHLDFKLDNVVYCKDQDRFKLIDWELSQPLHTLESLFRTRGSRGSRESEKPYGSDFSSSPVALYLYRGNIDHRYRYFTIAYIHTKLMKMPISRSALRDFMQFCETDIYIPFESYIASLPAANHTTEYLFRTFQYHFDTYSLGIAIALLYFIRNLPAKYIEFAKRLVNLQHPEFLGSAKEALSAFATIV